MQQNSSWLLMEMLISEKRPKFWQWKSKDLLTTAFISRKKSGLQKKYNVIVTCNKRFSVCPGFWHHQGTGPNLFSRKKTVLFPPWLASSLTTQKRKVKNCVLKSKSVGSPFRGRRRGRRWRHTSRGGNDAPVPLFLRVPLGLLFPPLELLLGLFHLTLHRFQMLKSYFPTLAPRFTGFLHRIKHGAELGQPVAVHGGDTL